MLVEGGGDLLSLKSHGGWKSPSVAVGYIDNSIARKLQLSRKLFQNPHGNSSTADENTTRHVRDKRLSGNETDFFYIDQIFANSEDAESPPRKVKHMGKSIYIYI